MSNRRYDDEDLEIPQIDGMENKKNLEATDAAGIPLFLKGEDSANKKPVKRAVEEDEEIPDFLTGKSDTRSDTETKVAPAVLSEMDEDPQPIQYGRKDKKSSIAGTIILSILIFIVLTAVLMFVGIKVVDHFAPKPSIAPLEPVTTVTPEASPTASAVVVEEGA